MPTDRSRTGYAVLALIGLWVVVYWWTPLPEGRGPSVYMEGDVAQGSTEVVEAEEPSAPPSIVFAESARGTEPAKPPSAPAGPAGPLDPTAPPALTSGVLPPVFRPYAVQAGDTAQSISQRMYGTSRHWRRVAQANPFVDFMHLKVGQEIMVPVDPENVQGVPAPAAELPKGAAEYIVRAGDTLSSIAKASYGKSSAWRDILEANAALLKGDETALRPGMRLVIPAAP